MTPRRITIPREVLQKARESGLALEYVVKVDWPELRLTEDQMLANATAQASGQAVPYPDPSILTIVIPAGQ